jgi:hypothetical protein
MKMSGQLHVPAALPPGKEPLVDPLDRRLSGALSRSGRGGEEKNSKPPPGIGDEKVIQNDIRRTRKEETRCRRENSIKIFEEIGFGVCGLDSSGSRWGKMAGSCEHGKEPSGSTKGLNFLTS